MKSQITRDHQLSGRRIPTSWLKKYSDENYGVLNRSLDVDSLLQAGYEEIIIQGQIAHAHAFGQPTKYHYRMIMETEDGIVLTQDLWLEQLRELVQKVYETELNLN